MELFNLFWIFLIISAVVPLLRQRMVDASRLRIMRAIEQQRGSRVITLIHRQERMSFLGFPMARYIDIQDSESVLRAIKLTDPKVPIDLILHTPGGLVLASEQIANALARHPAKVTVLVPHYAMSGGTLIALAANEIIMDENAVLGPVDPQVGQFPAASILKVLESKDANKIDDNTMILADIAAKAVNQVKATIRRLGCCHYTPEEAERLAEDLASGRWTHDYPITIEEARQLGLKIRTDMPTLVYQLMNLYPQATTHRPSVDFVPLPYPQRPALPERSDRQNRYSHQEMNMSRKNREVLDPPPKPEVEPASAGAAQARPGWLRRLGHTLFSSETRIGRVIRAILIGTGLVIVAFGLGMLVSYLWLTRPLTIQLSQSQADLQAVQTELNQARDRLSAVEAGALALQAENKALETQLLQAETRIQLMWVMYQARLAQNALQNRDQATARRALQAARAELDAALPVIEAKDEEVAQSLSLRLNVATNEMVRAPTTARADLEVLINNLILLERLLAQP